MLSFRLCSSDSGGAWRAFPGFLVSGSSQIVPFAHPALETVMVNSSTDLFCFIRERSARINGPERALGISVNELTVVDDTTFESLVRELAHWPLQWHSLLVTGSGAGPLAMLNSGFWGTAPIFLVAEPGELRGDWDASRLLPRLATSSLDPVRTARYLSEYANPYARDTLFQGLGLLTERARATWDGVNFNITYPEAWPRPHASELREGADPVGALIEILDASIARWLDLPDLQVGIEVSGGLDSAFIASRVATSRANSRCYGVALIDGPERGQDRRRAEIVERFGLVDTAIQMQQFLPLAPGSCRLDGSAPCLPWEEGYYETFDALVKTAAAHGIEVLMTGFGGDELCGLRPSELRALRSGLGLPPPQSAASVLAVPPPFLSPGARRTLAIELELPPRSASSQSSIECAAFSAARYMRHGIWPVHPLCTPELVHFCARLPPLWRYQRRIEREALARAGLSPNVTSPSHIDNFVPAMVAALRGPSQPILRKLFRSPALHDLSIVDRDALIDSYDRWCQRGDDDDAVLYLAAAITELCLNAMN